MYSHHKPLEWLNLSPSISYSCLLRVNCVQNIVLCPDLWECMSVCGGEGRMKLKCILQKWKFLPSFSKLFRFWNIKILYHEEAWYEYQKACTRMCYQDILHLLCWNRSLFSQNINIKDKIAQYQIFSYKFPKFQYN